MKILVIGGQGDSYLTHPDVVLAELLHRAFGWETRFSFFVRADANNAAQAAILHGDPVELTHECERAIVETLSAFEPDVTLMRLPRSTEYQEAQTALRSRVRDHGMGLVVWAPTHGDGAQIEIEQPLADVIPASNVAPRGIAYAPAWQGSHRLTLGVPLDQLPPATDLLEFLGPARDFGAEALPPEDLAAEGVIRVCTAGQGRVVLFGYNTLYGLGPLTSWESVPIPPGKETVLELLRDRPDWGEVHLRLIRRAVEWAKGEDLSQRVAIGIAPTEEVLPAQDTVRLQVTVLNETDAAVAGVLRASVDASAIVDAAVITAEPGTSSHELDIAIAPEKRGRYVPIEVKFVDSDGGILGQPAATAIRYVKMRWPIELALAASPHGAARNASIAVTASIADVGDRLFRIVWSVQDYQGQVIAIERRSLRSTTGTALVDRFEWKIPPLDPTHYRYVVRATLFEDAAVVGDATVPVYRTEPYSLGEGLRYGVWTSLRLYPEAVVPAWLDLYADAGYASLHNDGRAFQIAYLEERNWRGYGELLHNMPLYRWATLTDREAQLAEARGNVARAIDGAHPGRGFNPIDQTSAVPVVSLGEEATFTYGDNERVPPPPGSVSDALHGEWVEFLKARFNETRLDRLLDQINERCGTAFAQWSEAKLTEVVVGVFTAIRGFTGLVGSQQVAGFLGADFNLPFVILQAAFIRSIGQRAYDAHTEALRERNASLRTLISQANVLGTAQDVPGPLDRTHRFRIEWRVLDVVANVAAALGRSFVEGVAMEVHWHAPVVFNADLSHSRATMWQRHGLRQANVVAPVMLHAQAMEDPAVAVFRPGTDFGHEFHELIYEELGQFVAARPADTWRELLQTLGIAAVGQLGEQTKLAILPLAVTLSDADVVLLRRIAENGGVVLTTAGTARYDASGRQFEQYPSPRLAALLGVTLEPPRSDALGCYQTRKARWTLETWPFGARPSGPFFSLGRDAIRDQAPDVQVLGWYETAAAHTEAALLYRRVGNGHVFHFNGVYQFRDLQEGSEAMPRWIEMAYFVEALLRLAHVSPVIKVSEYGRLLDGVPWNVAGAGTSQPGPGDVVYVRIAGGFDKQTIRVESTRKVAVAYDAFNQTRLSVGHSNGTWQTKLARGSRRAAHFVALLPYKPAALRLHLPRGPVAAGSLLPVWIRIVDGRSRVVPGRHVVRVETIVRQRTISQWAEIAGEGEVQLPIDAWADGMLTISVRDLTSGLSKTARVRVKPSRTAEESFPPPPMLRRTLPPRPLSSDEVVGALDRLARVYSQPPSASPGAAKRRLGYYAFVLDESRHNLSARLLGPSRWEPSSLRAALATSPAAPRRWILTGEDLGVDPLQNQRIHARDHIGEVAQVIAGAVSKHSVLGSPDQVVFMFAGGGWLLLDRRSFDNAPPATGLMGDEAYVNSLEQFDLLQEEWWWALQRHQLLQSSSGPPIGLGELPADFRLAPWWREGFSDELRQAIADQGDAFNQPNRYVPETLTTTRATYTVGPVLFSDDFGTSSNDNWTLGPLGRWQPQRGRLVQGYSRREFLEAESWGDAASRPIPGSRDTPIVVEACGSIIKAWHIYGVFGVQAPGGYEVAYRQSLLFASHDYDTGERQLIQTGPTKLTAVQFVLVVDPEIPGALAAKVWNLDSEPVPENWQVDRVFPPPADASVVASDELRLLTQSFGFWRSVRVWKLHRM